MDEKPQDSQLTFDPNKVQIQPVIEQKQVEGQPPPQKEPLQPKDLPEKFRGKSPDEVLEIALHQDSIIGRLGKEVGDLRDQTQRILQQSNIRTQGPDLMPQHYPQPPQQGQVNFLDNLLSEQSETFFKQKVKEETARTILELQQAQSYLANQQYQGELSRIEKESDRIYRRIADEEQIPYEDVASMINREFRQDRTLQERVYGKPYEISSNEIEDGVKTLYKKAKETKTKEIGRMLKDYGIDTETITQLAKARKEVAAGATPESGSASHSTGGNTSRPKEELAILREWGLIDK